ncbi:hypothetical protein BC628DRAFT_1401357, partial [Trametes gibbosa]
TRRMCQRVPVQRFKAVRGERRRAHAMSCARGAHPPGAVSRCDTRPKRRPRYRRRTRTGLSVVPCGAYGPTSVRGRAARTVRASTPTCTRPDGCAECDLLDDLWRRVTVADGERRGRAGCDAHSRRRRRVRRPGAMRSARRPYSCRQYTLGGVCSHPRR